MAFEKTQGLLILLAMLFLFSQINVNPQLGFIYMGMTIAAYLILDDNRFIKTGVFKSRPNYMSALAWGAGAYIAFFFVATYGINILFDLLPGETIQSITATYVQSALETSEILKTLNFGVLIPIIESLLFFGALPLVISQFTGFKLSTNFQDPKLWFIIILASTTFAIFHFSAKGVTNSKALAVSFLFAVASMILVLFRGQWAEAISFHIINNLHALDVFNI